MCASVDLRDFLDDSVARDRQIFNCCTTAPRHGRAAQCTEGEAQAVAALYSVQPLLGVAATESGLREQASHASLLHLAAHGGYNPVDPLHSLTALAPDKINDGWLTAGEVYGLDLQGADLVVLSTCQSQLGRLSARTELVGLSRAFIYADTPSLVASLWSADDESARFSMERFYGYVKQGQGKGAVLRQAQLDTLAQEKRASPYYWAAFTLIRDIGETEFIASSHRT